VLFAAHQPHYLPWLRYLAKVAAADVFVLLDDVQYAKNGWQNRTRIKGPEGPVLLTIPVHARLGQRICDVPSVGTPWARRHLRALDVFYGSDLAAWRGKLADVLAEHGQAPLAKLNEALLHLLLEAFEIETPLVRSSDLGVGGGGSTRLAAIGRALGADAYLTGAYALEAYLDLSPFSAAGIDIEIQRWECPSYRQRFERAGFVSDLSAVDLLANEPHAALAILTSGREVRCDPALAAHARS
jgi:hypothetical protein